MYFTKKSFISIISILVIGIGIGFVFYKNFNSDAVAVDFQFDEQQATIMAINKVNPAVVSIIVYATEETVHIDLSTGKQTVEPIKVEKGSGTGFIISPDGLIITNKHVVNATNEKNGEYRIILNSGKQYYAQLIGKDPLNDLAVLKIFDKDLPVIELGDSDKLQIGTSVIAIGNALGLYRNSATKGIVSALGRSVAASDQRGVTTFDNVIQTDAQINLGNSGGPLIDLTGQVVGVSSAADLSGTSIGFAIPINDARRVIQSVKEYGRIIRARLGVRYIMLTPEVAQDKGLIKDEGALVIAGEDGETAITPDSPASQAGLEEGDIIFEINAIKIEGTKSLLSIIQRYKPGDKIGMKIQRGDKILIKVLTLDEFK